MPGIRERLVKLEAKRGQQPPPPDEDYDIWARAAAGDPDARWRLERIQQFLNVVKARRERFVKEQEV